MKLVLVMVAMTGCASDEQTVEFQCHAPETPYFSCEPIDPSESTHADCSGGPTYTSSAHDDRIEVEPDKVFPAGCLYHADECGCCWGGGRTFICEGNGAWSEPI